MILRWKGFGQIDWDMLADSFEFLSLLQGFLGLLSYFEVLKEEAEGLFLLNNFK